MRPIVHAEKHLLQRSPFTVASGAITVINIALGISDPAAASGVHVREGSTISAIYCEMWVQSDDPTFGNTVTTLEKVEGTGVDMAAGDAAALNAYDNKKNIIYTQIGLISDNLTYPMNVIKGWFKIPKGKQRMGLNDRWNLNIFAQSNGITGCGIFIFKEQY